MALGSTLAIGKMRNRVVFMRRSMAQDAVGGQSEIWTALGSVWASIEALAGRELEAAQAVHATATHTVLVRHISGLSAKDRFVYSDADSIVHTYDIIAPPVDVEMRHRFHECTVAEGLTPG